MSLNPVDFMIRQTGLTRAEFTAKHDFGKNLLLRYSQGRVASVTPRVAKALWDEWKARGIDQDSFDQEYNTLDIDVAYQRWVHNRRLLNKAKLPTKLSQDTKISPFGRVVQAVGSISMTAKLLVVPDVAVQRYADGRHKAMPEIIDTALRAMQYPHRTELADAQERWLEGRS